MIGNARVLDSKICCRSHFLTASNRFPNQLIRHLYIPNLHSQVAITGQTLNQQSFKPEIVRIRS